MIAPTVPVPVNALTPTKINTNMRSRRMMAYASIKYIFCFVMPASLSV
jgi:hypothetical protein